jgi:hypothetical protein
MRLVPLVCALASAATVALPALAADAPRTNAPDVSGFRCDGTDPFFFDELQRAQADRVGYGETWDERTCDEGAEIYAEGSTSQWRALKRKKIRATDEEQALALVLPMVSFGGLAAVALAAAVLALAARLRRVSVLQAPCPACGAELPVEAREHTEHMFCPMCGAPCIVEVRGKGAHTTAIAREAS